MILSLLPVQFEGEEQPDIYRGLETFHCRGKSGPRPAMPVSKARRGRFPERIYCAEKRCVSTVGSRRVSRLDEFWCASIAALYAEC
jgi:hypothetical protein